jgi:hypothetical protein
MSCNYFSKPTDGVSATATLQARQVMPTWTFDCHKNEEVCVSVLATFEVVETFYSNADNIVQNNMCFGFFCNPTFRSIAKAI